MRITSTSLKVPPTALVIPDPIFRFESEEFARSALARNDVRPNVNLEGVVILETLKVCAAIYLQIPEIEIWLVQSTE